MFIWTSLLILFYYYFYFVVGAGYYGKVMRYVETLHQKLNIVIGK